MDRQQVTVLLSGGLDSSVALHWASRYHNVRLALSFHYGSKHAVHELECARLQADSLDIEHRVIDISAISRHLKSALLEGGDPIPDGNYDESNMIQTVVPFRNGIFLSIAAGIAESMESTALVIAAHAGDHTIYPDCREEFMKAMSDAIRLGTYAGMEILRPFIEYSKGDIVRTGHDLGVDFSKTYSCYKGGDIHCGTCGTCMERKEAFRNAGLQDPTNYLR
ncbi:7-cyano-7-deazaguanine synthase QueC [Akkermansia sp. N21116]|jgi:7-cyano-7-deazaguanine synthase|uniref:7-cyano-7-deazaguanine synthase QueC n=1 Tax=Akkermansia sp. N21116 TaxID=3040764 RepID=UPI00244EBD76|nr:7-cyano-7-deazaguanine synthase QueC [Akkermansia sp. N21116]WPX40230.1 7-cyano-7-deazaguanine synthase QueC [Akkermansia sp. N21116]